MWSTVYEVYSTIKKLQHYRKVSVLVQPSYLETWKLDPVPLAVVTECQQRASHSTELQFPPSITSISRSLFANTRALAKSFSSVVFLVRRSRQFGLTGRKASRYTGGEPGHFYRLYCDREDKVARQDYQTFKVIPRKRKTFQVLIVLLQKKITERLPRRLVVIHAVELP